MKIKKNILILSLYNTHLKSLPDNNCTEYLKLFEHYQDLLANIQDEDLKNRIMYAHLHIDEFLFNQITINSKTFYEFGFNDLKNLLFSEQKIHEKNNKK